MANVFKISWRMLSGFFATTTLCTMHHIGSGLVWSIQRAKEDFRKHCLCADLLLQGVDGCVMSVQHCPKHYFKIGSDDDNKYSNIRNVVSLTWSQAALHEGNACCWRWSGEYWLERSPHGGAAICRAVVVVVSAGSSGTVGDQQAWRHCWWRLQAVHHRD